MLKEILIVDSIAEFIRYAPMQAYNNQVFQEQGGGYFFIEMNEECPAVQEVYRKLAEDEIEEGYMDIVRPCVDCTDCTQCIHPLPLKIAYFIMQAMRMQRQAFDLAIPPSQDGVEEALGHYLGIPKESQEDKR